MSRREYTMNLRCADPTCRETSISVSSTRRDEAEAYAYYRKKPWRCTRHTRPGEVLSVGAPERTATVEVGPDDEYGHRYWDHSGVVSGPGFKAFAKDFPPGTRLVVTARIELPSDAEAGQ